VFRDYFVIEVDGIAIVGQTFVPAIEYQYPVVCLCHGAPSGNPPNPDDGGYPVLAEIICRLGYHVVFFNFRGVGDSGGSFAMPGWTRDLQAVVDYILGLEGNSNRGLYLVGFSAGAATSIYVAARDNRVSGVAACACPADFSLFLERGDPEAIVAGYREIGAIRDADFPASAQEWLDDFVPITPTDHVARIAPRPLLLVHGSQDDVVPVAHAHRLYDTAGEPKRLVVVEGAGHRLRREPAVIKAVTDWLDQCRQNEPAELTD
jgi:dipeptidyl aminopeptidase/acylaminoacyl peptidase